MDKYVHRARESAIVSSLSCPKCQQPFIYNYRYGNDCKHHLVDENAVQEIVERLTTQYLSEEKAVKLHFRFTMTLEKLKQFGWFELRCHDFNPEKELRQLEKYSDRLALENYLSMKPQECFLITLLIHCIEHIVQLENLHAQALIKQQWLSYLKIIMKLIQEKSRISIQISKDLTSELYRLTMLQTTQLVYLLQRSSIFDAESDSEEANVLIVQGWLEELETNPSMRIDTAQYTRYSIILEDFYKERGQTVLVDSERLVRDIEESTPPNLKGVWRKCPQGHFYCTPLTIGKKQLSDCQECIPH